METLFAQFMALFGTAALIAAIINSLKTLGLLQNGDAPKASLLLNLGGFVLLGVFSVFAPTLDVAGLDATAGVIAQILTLVAGLVVQFGLTKGAHGLLKGAPVIGKSFSARA